LILLRVAPTQPAAPVATPGSAAMVVSALTIVVLWLMFSC